MERRSTIRIYTSLNHNVKMSLSVPDWLEKYSGPKNEPSRTSREEVFKLLQEGDETLILDLRNDREPGYITHSIHIPATEICGYEEIKEKVLVPIAQQFPKTRLIVVHCNSSGRRASKVGGWLEDYSREHNTAVKVTILHEGIKGWLAAGAPFDSLVTKV